MFCRFIHFNSDVTSVILYGGVKFGYTPFKTHYYFIARWTPIPQLGGSSDAVARYVSIA